MRPLLTSILALTAALAAPALAQTSAPQPVPFTDTIPAARDIPYPGTMTIHVDATDTARAILRVKQRIPVAGPGPMVLLLPEWLPGKHAPRGEAEKIAGLRISANGQPLAWERDNVDVYAFHVDVPAGARALDIEFQNVTPTDSAQGRIVITDAMMNLQPEMVSLYPAGYFTRQIPVSMTVEYPEGWTARSGLPATATGSTYVYQTTDYETLIDSPVFAGRHFAEYDLGHNVDLNIVADEAKYLAATPEQIEAHRRLVDQSVKLFGTEQWDNYEFLVALTDEMGGIGLEHHRSSENGVNPEYFTEWDDGIGRKGLLPHEIVHSWNGKHRRPAAMWTPTFAVPMRDDLLWVYEGQTQFWGNILAARSGIFSKQEALDSLAATAATYDTLPGQTWRPLEDTTNDPIITPREPKAWRSWQRSEDYYSEGMLVWLEADAIIREETNGRKSMDDFARAFFGQSPGDWGVDTYMFGDVVATLNGVVEYDWADFLTRRLTETTPGAPLGGITEGGYRLIYTEEPAEYWKDGEKRGEQVDLSYSLGIAVGNDGEIGSVMWDGPAFDEGLAIGSDIVAVNGREYSGERLTAAVTEAKAGEPVRLLVKSGDRYRDIAIDYQGGLRYPRLEKTGRGEGGLDKLLAPLD